VRKFKSLCFASEALRAKPIVPLPPNYLPLSILQDHPIRNYAEHSREVFSLNWNNIKKELFASGSWDGSAKIVSVEEISSSAKIYSLNS